MKELSIEEMFKMVLSVEGFMTNEDVRVLFELSKKIPKGGKIVELGCQKGKSITTICLGSGSTDVTVVDKWCGNVNEQKRFHGLIDIIDFIYNLDRGVGFVPTIIYDDTWNASKRFEDESIDFIYIDAEHKFEYVYRDIVNWYPKMKKGGIFAGHDYQASH